MVDYICDPARRPGSVRELGYKRLEGQETRYDILIVTEGNEAGGRDKNNLVVITEVPPG